MVESLPKEKPFIMMFKSENGQAFGSFSLGLKSKTFFFSFSTIKTNSEEKEEGS
jgi:hypothetical protein